MKHYIGVVHHEDGSAYGIHFPDVPGCFSAADEFDNLVANATEALALHLEDVDHLPDPRAISDLHADQEVAADLATGAVLIAVPFVRLSGRTTKANITLDAGLLNAIDQTAKARKLTRSAFLADLARREIASDQAIIAHKSLNEAASEAVEHYAQRMGLGKQRTKKGTIKKVRAKKTATKKAPAKKTGVKKNALKAPAKKRDNQRRASA